MQTLFGPSYQPPTVVFSCAGQVRDVDHDILVRRDVLRVHTDEVRTLLGLRVGRQFRVPLVERDGVLRQFDARALRPVIHVLFLEVRRRLDGGRHPEDGDFRALDRLAGRRRWRAPASRSYRLPPSRRRRRCRCRCASCHSRRRASACPSRCCRHHRPRGSPQPAAAVAPARNRRRVMIVRAPNPLLISRPDIVLSPSAMNTAVQHIPTLSPGPGRFWRCSHPPLPWAATPARTPGRRHHSERCHRWLAYRHERRLRPMTVRLVHRADHALVRAAQMVLDQPVARSSSRSRRASRMT